MKRMGQLMKEIGFNQDAPDSVKEAFIKHLIHASEGVHVMTPSERAEIVQSGNKVSTLPDRRTEPVQLSFGFFSSTGTEKK